MHGLAGAPLACALVLGALGGILWVYEHHFQRFTLWLLAASSACLVAGIPAWRDALAGLTVTGAGLTVLVVLVMVIGPAFHFSAVRTGRPGRMGSLLSRRKKGVPGSAVAVAPAHPRRNRYHRTLSPVVAMVAGTLFVVILGGWRILLKNAGRSAAGTLHALVQSGTKINNGSAARDLPASHRPGVIIAGAVILLLIVAAMRAHERRRHGGKGKGGASRGGLPGLPAGRPS